MTYWSELYKELSELIKKNLTQIQWVDLWHEQISYLTEELLFPTPAIFLSFSMLDAEDRGLFIQDCNTQVDVFLFYETFSDTYLGSYNQETAISYLDSLTEVHALLHGKSGKNYSQMRRVAMSREESGGAGNLYRISFQCLINDSSAATLFTEISNPKADIRVVEGKRDNKAASESLFII